MSTILTHAITGAALAAVAEKSPSVATVSVAAACAVLPDLDGIGYWLGIPYGSLFGHRGFLHSLPFAIIVAGIATSLFFRGDRPLLHFFLLFASVASHGLLDAMTDGGKGIAFFSPFVTTRYFFPFRPLVVPPLSIGAFFTAYGIMVLKSEALWVWLPLGGAVLIARAARMLRPF